MKIKFRVDQKRQNFKGDEVSIRFDLHLLLARLFKSCVLALNMTIRDF